MINIYKNYWKKSLVFSGKSSWKELLICLVITLLLLAVTYLIPILLPPSLENLGSDLWDILTAFLLFPMIAMTVRVLNK
ncbi:hypothetical protein [Streptococcus sp. sy010]|nr:hypothetical protein [Streptococcus sp. sy010]TWT14703.1 hypothetical protein FRX51_03790 [Streptococcus sp. sy010]